LRFLFPLTNNTLANTTGSYDISWISDGKKCEVEDMTDADIVVIKSEDSKNPNDDYSVISLAPGISMVTVNVEKNGVIGQRQLRLVPTSAITMVQNTESDVTSGLDALIYAVPDGERTDESLNVNYLTYKEVNYDHRIGMFFATGNEMGQNVQKQGLEGIEQNTVDQFTSVALNEQPGGTVIISVQKKVANGELEELTINDDFVKLFTGKRAALSKDIGEYYINYRWYLNSNNVGSNSGYLQTRKKLTILPAVTPVFYRNYDKEDKTEVVLEAGSIPENQKALYYKNGDKLEILPNNPERKGYDFVGWSLDREGFGDNETLKIDKDSSIDTDWSNDNYKVPLYAIWKAKKVSVEYQNKDGESIKEEQDTDQPIKLPKEEPKKPGYSFTGWTPDPKGEDPYPDLDKKTILDLIKDYPDILDDDVIFYPVFEKNPDPEVTVKVENKTDPSSNEAQVYDILTYTITATNKEKDTKWKDVGIKNKLPEGLTLVEDSIKLIDPEGKEIKLNVKDVYNEKTRTIEVPIELIEGGTNYQIVYDVYINDKSLTDKDKDIHNTIEVEGKNPDGTPTKVEEETVLPEGGEEIKLADPKPDKKVTVENKTDPKREEPKKGDELEYTVEVTNTQENSEWKDGYIEEEIPEGVELIGDTIEVEYPDGHKEILKIEDVYDEETRTLRIPVGTLYGNESIKIKYNVKVLNEEVVIDKEEEPSEPKDKLEKENLGENVKTSDETNAFLFVGGMIVSLIVIGLMTRKKREN